MNYFKIIASLSLFSTVALAQPYFQNTYGKPGAILSSGTIAYGSNGSTSGYLMGGYVPSTSPSAANFYIDKTDNSGGFATWNDFSQEYTIYRDNTCNGVFSQALVCAGVSVIEAQPFQPNSFALAGAVDDGCFFATLDAVGAVQTSQFYPFPSGASLPTKPFIINNPNGNNYIICGSVVLPSNGIQMYIMVVDQVGSIMASYFFNSFGALTPSGPCPLPDGYQLKPNAMTLAPFPNLSFPTGAPELVIVGEAPYYSTCGSAPDAAFTLRLDPNTLTVIDLNLITSTQQSTINRFTSIAPANMLMDSYVIGGQTNGMAGSTTSESWILKMNVDLNAPFNTFVVELPNITTTSKAVTSIVERWSSVNNRYELYSTVDIGTIGMAVAKTDGYGDELMPIAGTLSSDEFQYVMPGSAGDVNSISFDDSSLGFGTGIHVFGTNYPSGGNRYHVVSAAFNGEVNPSATPCATSLLDSALVAFPCPFNMLTNRPVHFYPGPTHCAMQLIDASSSTGIANYCSSAAVPSTGANNRTTGLKNMNSESLSVSISPNPSNGLFSISANGSIDKLSNVEIRNSIGQLVKSIDLSKVENQILEIDLNQLNIEQGIYIISGLIDGVSFNQKLIYTK